MAVVAEVFQTQGVDAVSAPGSFPAQHDVVPRVEKLVMGQRTNKQSETTTGPGTMLDEWQLMQLAAAALLQPKQHEPHLATAAHQAWQGAGLHRPYSVKQQQAGNDRNLAFIRNHSDQSPSFHGRRAANRRKPRLPHDSEESDELKCSSSKCTADLDDDMDADEHQPPAALQLASSSNRRKRTAGGSSSSSSQRSKQTAIATPADVAPEADTYQLSAAAVTAGVDTTDIGLLAARTLSRRLSSGYVSETIRTQSGFLDNLDDYDAGCDADDAVGWGAIGAAGLTRQDRLKEKNRLAQRRFRARQKTMLEQMQTRMDELTKQVELRSKDMLMLQKENQLLRNIVQEQQKVLMSAVAAQQQQQAGYRAADCTPGQSIQQQQDQLHWQLLELYQMQMKLNQQQQY